MSFTRLSQHYLIMLRRHPDLIEPSNRTSCQFVATAVAGKLAVVSTAAYFAERDVFVTCDREFDAKQAVFAAPILIIEVLSPSTQGYDRSQNFAICRRLESLREYALIDPETRRVEVYRVGEEGRWNLFDMSEGPALDLATVNARITLESLFKGMGSG
jgi:Uma2 family endonuclease